MKDTKTTKSIKRKIKLLQRQFKMSSNPNNQNLADEINFLEGRLSHYKFVAKKYHR